MRREALTAIDYASGERRDPNGFLRVGLTLLRLHPLSIFGSIYSAWLFACAYLGRRPVPMQDDPKDLGAGFGILYAITMVLIVTWPVIACIGAAAMIATVRRLRDWWWLAANASLYLLLYVTVNWDPNRVVEWLFD